MCPNIYEKETRTAVHLTQEKLNIAEEEISNLKEVVRNEKKQDRLIGSLMIIGMLLVNFVIPHIRPLAILLNFSPKIGPVDCAVILIGAMFLWKGLK